MARPLSKRGNLPAGRPDKDTMDWRYIMVGRFKKIVSVDDVDQIIQVAVSDAITGDKDERASARTWLSPFLFPKPSPDIGEVNVEGGINQYVINMTDEQLDALTSIDLNQISTIDADVTDATSTPS